MYKLKDDVVLSRWYVIGAFASLVRTEYGDTIYSRTNNGKGIAYISSLTLYSVFAIDD